MLQYHGKAVVLDGDGNSLPQDEYEVQAEVVEVVDGRVRFAEVKRFSNGFVLPGEFEWDLKGRPAQFAEKGLSTVYTGRNECVGSMSIQGKPFSLCANVGFSSIRNLLFNSEKVYIETLSPRISDLADLSSDERSICNFVREKALRFLDVRAIVLYGSRAMRSHHEGSDFDFGIEASGKRGDWLALADCLHNEAPSLCEIQVVELSHSLKIDFVASVYRNGRFIYG